MGILETLLGNFLQKRQMQQETERKLGEEHIKTAHELIKKGDLTPDQTTWLANVGAQYGDPLIEGYGRNTYKKSKEQADYGKGVQDFVMQLVGGVMGGSGGGSGGQEQPQMGDAGIQASPQLMQAQTQPQQMTLGVPTKGKPSFGEYDISSYATDPAHEQRIASILPAVRGLSTPQDITAYIQQVAPKSPITGDVVLASAQKHGVDPGMMLALMQQDSSFGTAGKGARTFNPGNVGNDDTGREVNMGSWDKGVDAVGGWLAQHRTGSAQVQRPAQNGTHLAPPTLRLPMGATFTVTDAGSGIPKLNLQFKMPTMDERESQTFAQLPGPQQLQFLTGKWAKAAGMEPIHKIDRDETTGQTIATTFDPMKGTMQIVGSGVKIAYTPIEQQGIAATGAGWKKQEEARVETVPIQTGGGGGAGGTGEMKTPAQIEAERQAGIVKATEAEKRRLIPGEGVKELGATQKVLDRIDRIKGIFAKHTNKDISLVGKMDFLREVGDSFDAFAEPDRIELRNLTAQLTESMYDTRGKQLSDREIKIAEKLIPKMGSQPVEYLTNLRAFQDYIEGAAKANKGAWERAGYTMDQVNVMPAERANALLETLQGSGGVGQGKQDMGRKADAGLQVGKVYPDGKGGHGKYLGGPKMDGKSWEEVTKKGGE